MFDQELKLPSLLAGALLVVFGLGGLHLSVEISRHGTLTKKYRLEEQERSLKHEQALRDKARLQEKAEADERLPDHYQVIIHEWSCKSGSLVAPVATLGPAQNSVWIPSAKPRVLLDGPSPNGVKVAHLNPDGSISYTEHSWMNCPPSAPDYEPFTDTIETPNPVLN